MRDGSVSILRIVRQIIINIYDNHNFSYINNLFSNLCIYCLSDIWHGVKPLPFIACLGSGGCLFMTPGS